MEIAGLEPEITICKIAVLPIKLYPLYYILLKYPKEDLNLYDIRSLNFKLRLSTNSSTRILINKKKYYIRPE